MKIFTFIFFGLILFLSANIAQAQKPRFENPERIQRLCEEGYNSHRKSKDCKCFVEKYKAKEMEIFKERGTGTVPPYDHVFRKIDHECHINDAASASELNDCMQSPPVAGLSGNQIDKFCKCQSKRLTDMSAMFTHMPNATAAMKKEMKDGLLVGMRRHCAEQAKR